MRGNAAIAKSGLMVTWLLISVWPTPAAIAGNGFPQPFDAGRWPSAGSPAFVPGREVPLGPVADFERREYGQPPNRGAFAGR